VPPQGTCGATGCFGCFSLFLQRIISQPWRVFPENLGADDERRIEEQRSARSSATCIFMYVPESQSYILRGLPLGPRVVAIAIISRNDNFVK